MELRPRLEYKRSCLTVNSYALIIYKNERLSLSYLVAKHHLTKQNQEKPNTEGCRGCNQYSVSPALLEISEEKTLQGSIRLFSKYLRSSFGITNDHIINLLQNNDDEKILVEF